MKHGKILLAASAVALVGWFVFLKQTPKVTEQVAAYHSENAGSASASSDGATAGTDTVRPVKDAQPWETEFDKAVLNSPDTSTAFREVLKMLPKAPQSAQGVLAKHLINLASDDDFRQLAPLLRDKSLSTGFHEVVAEDLLNRPDELKLRSLLAVASTEWHPMREFGLDALKNLTLEDVGENWKDWENIIAKHLAKTQGLAVETGEPTPSTPSTSSEDGSPLKRKGSFLGGNK